MSCQHAVRLLSVTCPRGRTHDGDGCGRAGNPDMSRAGGRPFNAATRGGNRRWRWPRPLGETLEGRPPSAHLTQEHPLARSPAGVIPGRRLAPRKSARSSGRRRSGEDRQAQPPEGLEHLARRHPRQFRRMGKGTWEIELPCHKKLTQRASTLRAMARFLAGATRARVTSAAPPLLGGEAENCAMP